MSERRVVLVVDDDRDVQQAVADELAHRDYEVVIAPDGESALRLLDTLQPQVLVLDLQLPDISGPTVASRLRLMTHPPRLLVCSAVPFAPEIAADLSADGILLKPFVRADLRAEVERLLG
jgi:DNA-binding response OmpR family regulator